MKNRKREICTSGSARDEAGQPPHLLGRRNFLHLAAGTAARPVRPIRRGENGSKGGWHRRPPIAISRTWPRGGVVTQRSGLSGSLQIPRHESKLCGWALSVKSTASVFRDQSKVSSVDTSQREALIPK